MMPRGVEHNPDYLKYGLIGGAISCDAVRR